MKYITLPFVQERLKNRSLIARQVLPDEIVEDNVQHGKIEDALLYAYLDSGFISRDTLRQEGNLAHLSKTVDSIATVAERFDKYKTDAALFDACMRSFLDHGVVARTKRLTIAVHVVAKAAGLEETLTAIPPLCLEKLRKSVTKSGAPIKKQKLWGVAFINQLRKELSEASTQYWPGSRKASFLDLVCLFL